MYNKNNKGISPVIAVSLLIVVTVVAVLAYQNWFVSYQTTLQSDVSIKSKDTDNIRVETISGSTLYVNNQGSNNQTFNSVNVNGIDCSINQNITPGVNEVDISSCLNQSGNNQVTIITQDSVIREEVFVKELSQSSNSFSKSLIWVYNFTYSPNGGSYHQIKIDNSSIYVTGYYSEMDWNDYIMFLRKYDTNGNLIWNITYNSYNEDYGYGIDFKDSNTITVFGEIYNGTTSKEWFSKYDIDKNTGNVLAVYNYTDPIDEQSYLDDYNYYLSDGNIVVKGNYGSFGNSIVKLDSNFNLIWNISGYNRIIVDSNDNIYGVGNSGLSKFDTNGNLIWNKTDVDGNLAKDSQNNIYISGMHIDDDLGWVGHIIKFDSNGNLLLNKTYPYVLSEIKIDSNNYIYCTGNWGSDFFIFNSNGDNVLNITNNYLGNPISIRDFITDSQNNLYLLGYYNNGSQNIGLIYKYQ